MTLSDLVRSIVGFANLPHAEKIKCFGWFLHEKDGKPRFQVADIRRCYNELHLDLPANLASSVEALALKKPPELLKQQGGYRLHGTIREKFERRFGATESTIVVEAALAALPSKVENESESVFLAEALTCYRHQAFRATIVMTWNLAYDHLLRWILKDAVRLAAFNTGISRRNSKKAHITIEKREDFEDLKEDEVVDIAASLPGVTANMKRVLKEKLGRRNTYAHPSTFVITKPQVDDMITDLVHNVVLRLSA